jgi:integrase
MAYFQKRDNNGCTARVRLKGHNESRTFYPASGKTARKLAEKWAQDEEEKILAGNYKSSIPARTTTLLQALNDYDDKFAKKLKGYSTEQYRINAWRTWKYKDSKLSDLTDAMFDEYRDDRRKYVKDGSIRLDLAVISAMFSKTNYGIPNPALATIATLAPSEKRNRRLRQGEQEYLFASLFDTQCSDPKRANHNLPLVAIFGLETACRMSEIVKDTREHTTGILRENIILDGDRSRVQIFDTKNGADRWVPLTQAAVEVINRACALHPAKSGLLFRTTAGAIKQAWNRAKKRAKDQYKADGGEDESFLANFHFHDLRHEAASRWKNDFDIHGLKDLTGHKDVRSLMRYVHSDEDDIGDMAAKMTKRQKEKRAAGDKKVFKLPPIKKKPKAATKK